MPSDPALLLAQIMVVLRLHYKSLDFHFEAAWTDSWNHRPCLFGWQ